MESFVLGIDMGSSGFKISLIDSNGKIKSKIQQEIRTNYPQPGWAEQDPFAWEKTLVELLNKVLGLDENIKKQIECIAISSATHTLVCVDNNGKPLRPAIMWTDKRTINEVEWLKNNYKTLIVSETLHAPNVNWSLPYLLWIKKHEPDVWSKIYKILMPKDYIRYQLTGIMATDWMDAHGTLLLNVLGRKWSDTICDEFEIPTRILPDIFDSTDTIGTVTDAAAKTYGLVSGIPVIVGTTDQACEAFGTGTTQVGSGLIKLATAGNVVVVTDKPFPDPPSVYAYYHIKKGLWSTMSGTSSCAVAYQWFRNIVYADPPAQTGKLYKEMDALAAEIQIGSEGLVFHPNFQGSLVDPFLKADFIGLTLRHEKGHLLRAILEGVGFSLYECILRENKIGVASKNYRIIGGGSKSKLWRQIICDITGKELIVPVEDDSSFGTALLAAIGAGFFKDIDEAVKMCVKITDKIQPNIKNHEIYHEMFKFYGDTQEALKQLYRSSENFTVKD